MLFITISVAGSVTCFSADLTLFDGDELVEFLGFAKEDSGSELGVLFFKIFGLLNGVKG